MHTPKNVSSSPRSPAKGIRSLHKLTGLAIAVPVLLLVLTGIPLEFVDQLKLGTRGVQYEWVHHSYGVQSPDSALKIDKVVQIEDLIIVADHTIEATAPLLAARDLNGFTMILTRTEWLLVPDDAGTPVERGGLPETAIRAAFAAGLPIVEGASGKQTSTDYGASWQTLEAPVHQWSTAESVDTLDEWKRIYGASVISWERWLQDLHSGRFFGQIGQWIMTFAGFALLVLAFSGFLIWFRTLRR